jgi:hypothetical protein
VTAGELVEELGTPQGTVCDYVQRLAAAGPLGRVIESRPYEYDAEAISLTLSVDGTTTTVPPALVAAIARVDVDEDIDVYVERHGLDGLAVALKYTFERVEGTVTHRTMARGLDCSPLEAEIILRALESVARTYSDAAERRPPTSLIRACSSGVTARTARSSNACDE